MCSMLIELVCNAGAMRKEILHVKFAISWDHLVVFSHQPHYYFALRCVSLLAYCPFGGLNDYLQEYKPGYTAPPRVQPDETAIDIRQVNYLIHMCDELIMNLRDPRILAVAAAQRRLLESDYDSYGGSDAGGAAFCRSAALILMALLLLRHALSISDNEGNDDDASTMFSLFLLRAAGFLLPCYIMAWIFSILHRRRQQQCFPNWQEEAALAAAEVAFILESARGRTLQFAIAPDSPATPQHATPQHEPSPQ
ncbi:hypothetical protein PR202_ga22376 [Eleusine coracana subsp. coracana]|uniref:Uncharacterized protein n=1 Tax=Eleusine coracana subsp. coracana TaxID=191504 RepID=A0AAV5D235_ELECO|nr:hypothetical protein PR202_ga22376 [Eleusine coracana subsp. coracana]